MARQLFSTPTREPSSERKSCLLSPFTYNLSYFPFLFPPCHYFIFFFLYYSLCYVPHTILLLSHFLSLPFSLFSTSLHPCLLFSLFLAQLPLLLLTHTFGFLPVQLLCDPEPDSEEHNSIFLTQ